MGRVRNATDLGIDLDAVPATPRGPGFDVLLEGTGPWDWSARVEGPCPVCGRRRLPRSHYCLRCDRAGADGKVAYPGLPVGRYPNREWEQEYGPMTATVYASDRGLRGGLGERVGTRKARRAESRKGA